MNNYKDGKKLIIQIPCFNEASTLPVTLKELPRKVNGFDVVEWLVVNDGSVDNTVEVARKYGVNHIINFNKNKGLAKAFMAGIETCIKLGADVIVNTDADNQYNAKDISKLVKPILEKRGDIVIGARPFDTIEHFTGFKKKLQKLGSYVVKIVSNLQIDDATSGFRAFSREAALKINVFNDYTYTLETIIQAGRKNMNVIFVPIRVNNDLRPSRLVKNNFSYVTKSIITILRIFIVYKPLKFFIIISTILFVIGLFFGFRFLFFFFNGNGLGHIQSLILTAILLIMGIQMAVLAFIGDLLSVNRNILEEIQYNLRKNNNRNN